MATENPWMKHLAEFREKNSDVDPKDMMREARKTYRGGAVTPYEQQNSASSASKVGGGVSNYEQRSLATTASSVGGRRKSRRSSRRSRSTRRKSKRSRRR